MGCCNSVDTHPAPAKAEQNSNSPTISATTINSTPISKTATLDTPCVGEAEPVPKLNKQEIKITITKSFTTNLPGHTQLPATTTFSNTNQLCPWDMTSIGPRTTIIHTPITLNCHNNIDLAIRMEITQAEQKFESERINQKCDAIFDKQIQSQHNFHSLYQIFNKYRINCDRATMDMDGLTQAMSVFGMVIDIDKELQKLVWSKFDLENNKEIEFADFSATMSAILTSKDDESLLLLFQIFDIDIDGYLMPYDVARLFLCWNHFATVATGQSQSETQVTYTKKMCLKQARKFIQDFATNGDGKISFEKFKAMMLSKTEKDMMIQYIEPPSNSFINMESPQMSYMMTNTTDVSGETDDLQTVPLSVDADVMRNSTSHFKAIDTFGDLNVYIPQRTMDATETNVMKTSKQ